MVRRHASILAAVAGLLALLAPARISACGAR